jgi:hypothetical protein
MALKNTNEMILKNLSSQERKQESTNLGGPFNIQINSVKLNEKKKTSPLDTSGSEEVIGDPTMKVMVDQKDSQQYKFKAESLRKMPPNMNL